MKNFVIFSKIIQISVRNGNIGGSGSCTVTLRVS